jgi:hypothetical protein
MSIVSKWRMRINIFPILKYNKAILDIFKFLILSFSFLFISSIIKQYHNSYVTIIILIVCLLLLTLTIINIGNGFLFLIVITPFFGNHPGGKYIEVFDMLLFLWISISLFRIEYVRRLSFINGLEWLFLLSGLLSILSNPDLLFDIVFTNTPTVFHIFSAVETNPLYSLKMFFSTLFCIISVLIIYNIYLTDGTKIISRILIAITATVSITMITGLLEAHIPRFQTALDQYHIIIDGYIVKTYHHNFSILSLLLKPIAIQSFFWNRGWYSVYLIATIPFLNLFIFDYLFNSIKQIQTKIILGIVYALSLMYILILIGARGALFAFCISLILFLILIILKRRLLNIIQYIMPIFVIGLLILFPLLIAYTSIGRRVDITRITHFQAGIITLLSNMLLGCGIEGYGIYNFKYLVPAGKGSLYGTTHNQLLQIASGQGLFGIIIYFSMIYYILYSLCRSLAEKKHYILPLLSGFIGILIYSSFQEWYYLRSVQLFWWLLIMVIMIYCKNSPGEKSPLGV